MGIAWLADSFPDAPPEHTRGSAADYASVPEEEPSAPASDGPGFTRGSAADYGDPSAAETPQDLHPIGRPAQNPAPTSVAYDGPWSETTQCDVLVDVSSVRANAATAGKRETLRALAELRYPPGVAFIEALSEEALNTFAPGSSFEKLIGAFDTVVHEGSHMWAAERMRLSRRTYSILPEDSRNLPRFETFDRSRIAPELDGPQADSYRRIYLEGDSGAQGFETLLDETNAYVHSIASATCIRDLYPQNQSRSSRDGILAMLYYVGEYLRLARIEEPEVYQRIRANQTYVRFVVDQWERAHYWLARSESSAHLGIHDDAYSERTHANRVRSEFEMFRRALRP
ncbi:MAG: hypothetical protein ACI9KE_001163 [Polyangiales bacterium]|jgi:hypothetical protein